MDPNGSGVKRSLDDEIAAEQAYVDAAYGRLDAMRSSAASVREAYADVRSGGTHQARLERDIAYDVTARRLAELDIGASPLVFGRLDEGDGNTWYVGRLAVDDDAHTPLVIDWRAPIAEPFYRATAVAPMGVARRRHLLTRDGRDVIGLDDEVFDPDAAIAAGFTVAGEGALLAALERHRTGRMGDIVATIQAEQDEAIRADLAGVLVVTGGPGTGKTAVALHRAAYLLYTHRRRLGAKGVLVVGPSAVFLRYIEQVLPSLGEQDVQLATITSLKPNLRVGESDAPSVAALKGDPRMAAVIERAVTDRERALAHDLTFTIDGLRVRLSREDSVRVVRGGRRQRVQRGSHNAARPYVVKRTVDLLIARYKQVAARVYQQRRLDHGDERDRSPGTIDALVGRALARGEPLPEGWEHELASRLRKRPEVRAALERMWPALSGVELVNDLYGFRALVASAARDLLTDDEQARLYRPRTGNTDDVSWSEADVAIVDEADSLLGPLDAARPRRRRRRGGDREAIDMAQRVVEELGVGAFTNAADIAARYDGAADDDGTHGETRTFGHVLVDEAQDLTAMQWRMLARRCPSSSFTLVGDPGQASRPGAMSDWSGVLAQLPERLGSPKPRFATLSINYRTPSEIMDVAARLLSVAAPTVEPSRSVRSTGERPRFVAAEPASLVARAAAVARDGRRRGGTVAVITPSDVQPELLDALRGTGAASGRDALDSPIAVLDATEAKGLEFDHVVVVEPARLVEPDRAGLRLLYVTITRATRSLAIVHAAALPEGLEPIA